MDSVIVYLIRQTGWSLEYATDLVRDLPAEKLNALLTEMSYQQACDDYKLACNSAMIIATWVNANSRRRYSLSHFVGYPPRREEEQNRLKAATKLAGIKTPED